MYKHRSDKDTQIDSHSTVPMHRLLPLIQAPHEEHSTAPVRISAIMRICPGIFAAGCFAAGESHSLNVNKPLVVLPQKLCCRGHALQWLWVCWPCTQWALRCTATPPHTQARHRHVSIVPCTELPAHRRVAGRAYSTRAQRPQLMCHLVVLEGAPL